jgi:hypothetical protein
MAKANSLCTIGAGKSVFGAWSQVLGRKGKIGVMPKYSFAKAEPITTIPNQPLRRDF